MGIYPQRVDVSSRRPPPMMSPTVSVCREGSVLEVIAQGVNTSSQIRVGLSQGLHTLQGVDDSGVITTTKEAPYHRQRGIGELTNQVHGDLTRKGYMAMATRPPEIGELHMKLIAHAFDDGVWGDLTSAL